MVNLIQSKQNKEFRNKGTIAGREKEKENNNLKALKQMGLKCFFCKKTWTYEEGMQEIQEMVGQAKG